MKLAFPLGFTLVPVKLTVLTGNPRNGQYERVSNFATGIKANVKMMNNSLVNPLFTFFYNTQLIIKINKNMLTLAAKETNKT